MHSIKYSNQCKICTRQYTNHTWASSNLHVDKCKAIETSKSRRGIFAGWHLWLEGHWGDSGHICFDFLSNPLTSGDVHQGIQGGRVCVSSILLAHAIGRIIKAFWSHHEGRKGSRAHNPFAVQKSLVTPQQTVETLSRSCRDVRKLGDASRPLAWQSNLQYRARDPEFGTTEDEARIVVFHWRNEHPWLSLTSWRNFHELYTSMWQVWRCGTHSLWGWFLGRDIAWQSIVSCSVWMQGCHRKGWMKPHVMDRILAVPRAQVMLQDIKDSKRINSPVVEASG